MARWRVLGHSPVFYLSSSYILEHFISQLSCFNINIFNSDLTTAEAHLSANYGAIIRRIRYLQTRSMPILSYVELGPYLIPLFLPFPFRSL
jgi:hypothetical protein